MLGHGGSAVLEGSANGAAKRPRRGVPKPRREARPHGRPPWGGTRPEWPERRTERRVLGQGHGGGRAVRPGRHEQACPVGSSSTPSPSRRPRRFRWTVFCTSSGRTASAPGRRRARRARSGSLRSAAASTCARSGRDSASGGAAPGESARRPRERFQPSADRPPCRRRGQPQARSPGTRSPRRSLKTAPACFSIGMPPGWTSPPTCSSNAAPLIEERANSQG